MTNILRTPLYNSFYHDFIEGKKITQKFLPQFKNSNWGKITESFCSKNAVHQKVKKIIADDNADILSSKGKKNIEWIQNDSTVFIVTGQQLGLFASPMYTIYKIITAIKLADSLNEQNNRYHYVPLFWLESEDHDFDEINHFGIWDKQFQPRVIRYQSKNTGKSSIKHHVLDDHIHQLFTELQKELVDTEFSINLFQKLERLFTPGNSWLNAAKEFLKDIFIDTGLLFFQPGKEEIKSISGTFFQNVLMNSEILESRLKNTSDKLNEAGYANQVTVILGKTFLFIEDNQMQREHLYRDAHNFYLSDTKTKLNLKEVSDLLNDAPRKISTSVVSRPLWQSWLLPTVAYIAGPGEIAYWAQISDLFAPMDLKIPVVYPRITATIVEPRINRFIKKYGVDIDHIPVHKKEFITEFLRAGENDSFRKVIESIDYALNQLKYNIINIDPTLESTWKKTRDRILGQIEFLENKSIKAKEQKEHTLSSQLNQIHQAFFPDGYPQERYVSIIYFLNKFGPDVFSKIYKSLKFDCFDHQIIST